MSHHSKRTATRKPSVNWRTSLISDQALQVNADHPPADEQIRLRAYQLYTERGAQPTDDLGDWLRAERELGEGAMSEALLGEHREIEP